MADGIEGQQDPVNPLELSDEDFAKLSMPGTDLAQPETTVETPGAEGPPVVVPPVSTESSGEGNNVQSGDAPPKPAGEEVPTGEQVPAGQAGAEGGVVSPGTEEQPAKTPEAKPADGAVPPSGSKPEGQQGADSEKPKGEGEAKVEAGSAEPLNYAQIGELVMKPFKANGKIFTPQSADEVIKLAQMGAHFTQKMQAIQPHRKVLTMLEKNDLLDADRLSFLIDLDKKNPEAIQKLIKDAGIDPLEIDTASEPKYEAGSHVVSDAEVKFTSAVEDLVSAPGGQEALQSFQETWDNTSKDMVWADPSLLSHMFTQKQSGVYDAISSEIERRRTLGDISPDVPFLKAYASVGDELHKAGQLDAIILKASPPDSRPSVQAPAAPAVIQSVPVPIATRVEAPKGQADNNDKVKAAAPTATGSRPAKPIVNPLAMSDEEFLTQFKGRI